MGEPKLRRAEAAIEESLEWGATLAMEREALQAHVAAMRTTARVALLDMLEGVGGGDGDGTPGAAPQLDQTATLIDVEETLADFADCANKGEQPPPAPDGDGNEAGSRRAEEAEVAALWRQLRDVRDGMVEGLRQRMQQTMALPVSATGKSDVQTLNALLRGGAPYGDVLASELLDLRKRRAELVNLIRQRLLDESQRGEDPALIDDALGHAEGIDELGAEVATLQARRRAVLEDGQMVLRRFLEQHELTGGAVRSSSGGCVALCCCDTGETPIGICANVIVWQTQGCAA